jgi:hypothetical protein
MSSVLKLPLFLLLSIPFRILAQDADERLPTDVLNERRIVRNDTLFLFSVAPEDKIIKPVETKIYYWFNRDTILHTTGGFGGRLLNGEYKVYYPDKSLRESGWFFYGLKDGDWRTWNPDGSLLKVIHWKKGEQ